MEPTTAAAWCATVIKVTTLIGHVDQFASTQR